MRRWMTCFRAIFPVTGEVLIRDPSRRYARFAEGEYGVVLHPAGDNVAVLLRDGLQATVPQGWVFAACDLRAVFGEVA